MVGLNDLSDEILIYILKKLSNVEVLYSLIDVNHRLSRIARDSTFTSHITLKFFFNDFIDPLPIPILDHFCLKILPSIDHKIKWLNAESSTLKRILLAGNYPNLYGLGVFDIDIERDVSLFSDKTVLTPAVKNQISSLVIDFEEETGTEDVITFIFIQILTTFNNLKYFNFGPSLFYDQRLLLYRVPSTVISSTLLELHVSLQDFSDCLYLLDGRFNQLHTLHVNIVFDLTSTLTTDNKEKLLSLRCFSLICNNITFIYDKTIVPFLHRMLNLEKLDLHLHINTSKGFVDGNYLKKSILNHMAQLNRFTFNIRSFIDCIDQTDVPSNEYIQETFRDFTNNQIVSYVDYFGKSRSGECHVYTYPYSCRQKSFKYITNQFPGGLFKYVREVFLFDQRPFEQEFFLRIAESFPLLTDLTIHNMVPQNDKQHSKAKDDKNNSSVVQYGLLFNLNLYEAHDDYLEQFLTDTKTSLPNNFSLCVEYQSLKRVTHNFKRDATRINCSKLGDLYTNDNLRFPKHFKDYFPCANINI